MRRKIWLASLALLLILGLLISSCAKPAPAPAPAPAPSPAPAEKPTYHWKYSAHLSPEHYTVIGAKKFAERVKELSGGRITIDVYDSGALGDWIPVFEEVMKGTIQLQVTSYNTVHDPRLNIVWIPYAVTNWDEVRRSYSPGGWIFDTAEKMNRDLGVTTIASLPDGFIGMGAKRLPPSPEDPDVPKDMKIRVWGAIPPEKLMERFGYLPTVMPWSEVFSALQTGVVEAVYGGSVISTYDTVRDVIKYWIPYRGNYEGLIVIMNLELFNSLSDEDRQIILQAAKEQQDARMAEAEQTEIEYTQKMRDYGIEVVEFTPEQYAHFREVAAKDVWPELEPIIGKKLLDDAIAAIAGGG